MTSTLDLGNLSVSCKQLLTENIQNTSSARFEVRNRIYQSLGNEITNPNLAPLNGYYSLAQSTTPSISAAASEKIVTTWTTRTSTADNTWNSVCWSPELGLFCAVASTGTNRVMTSPNGITWTAQTITANNWTSVCWAPNFGFFIAVSNSGTNTRIATSTDGITWTIPISPADNPWTSVCVAPEINRAVAVASTGTNQIMYTTNSTGTTWSTALQSETIEWRSVCWAPEISLFCAVGSSGTGNRVMTSPNGIIWTSANTVELNSWYSVCWSGRLGLFCAVAISGTNRVMTSPDGIVWTPRTAASAQNWYSVCWSDEANLFCAIAWGSSGQGVMFSFDGITWGLKSTPASIDNWFSVCWSPELSIFCAVSSSGTGNRVMTSCLANRIPTSYNVFDSPFNNITESGNWTFQQVYKNTTLSYTAGSTTPSVAGGNMLVISNTSNTTITNFIDAVVGQKLLLIFNSGSTILNQGTNLKLSANFTSATGSTMTLICSSVTSGIPTWVELSRSVN